MGPSHIRAYWYNHIVPEFNSFGSREAPAPIELYRSLLRANTLTPSWGCLSIFAEQKHRAKVFSNGFHYKKRLYDDLSLKKYIGKYIYVFDFASEYTNTVYAMYSEPGCLQDEFLGEIHTKEALEYIEPNKLKLARNLILYNLQVKALEEEVSAVHAISEKTCTARKLYIRYQAKDDKIIPFMLTEWPAGMFEAESSDETTILNSAAQKAAIERLKTTISVMEMSLES